MRLAELLARKVSPADASTDAIRLVGVRCAFPPPGGVGEPDFDPSYERQELRFVSVERGGRTVMIATGAVRFVARRPWGEVFEAVIFDLDGCRLGVCAIPNPPTIRATAKYHDTVTVGGLAYQP